MKLKDIDACQWHGFEIRYGESSDLDYGMQFRSTFVLPFHSHPFVAGLFALAPEWMGSLPNETITKFLPFPPSVFAVAMPK